MQSVHEIFASRCKSEGGFVFIAALMAVMILVAVGFLSLTVTGQDVLISSRLVGERKALSAAESGVHNVCWQLTPALGPPDYGVTFNTPTSIDSVRDPSISYTVTGRPVQNPLIPTIPLDGFDMSKAYVGSVYDTIVTGNDASYNSSVSIAIGTVYSPNPGDTHQGGL